MLEDDFDNEISSLKTIPGTSVFPSPNDSMKVLDTYTFADDKMDERGSEEDLETSSNGKTQWSIQENPK